MIEDFIIRLIPLAIKDKMMVTFLMNKGLEMLDRDEEESVIAFLSTTHSVTQEQVRIDVLVRKGTAGE